MLIKALIVWTLEFRLDLALRRPNADDRLPSRPQSRERIGHVPLRQFVELYMISIA